MTTPASNATPPAPDIIPCTPRSLLIVDDEAAILALYQKMIGRDFPTARIDTAANGAEGVRAFATGHHAVVLLDVFMPVMNGEEAYAEIETLCRQRAWEKPHVFFCTGYLPSDRLRTIVGDGARHRLLTKPFKIAEWRAALAPFLAASSHG